MSSTLHTIGKSTMLVFTGKYAVQYVIAFQQSMVKRDEKVWSETLE
jgi:hypothetical protein